MTADVVPLGVGYYRRVEAARLLGLSPPRLRRWVSGYTFWLESEQGRRRRREQDPVIGSDLPRVDGDIALSFLELMELRVAKALVDRGASLQRVREANLMLREHFGVRHPFASQPVYVDEKRHILVELNAEAGGTVMQLTGSGNLQLLSGPLLQPYLDEIIFDDKTGFTTEWWPLGRAFPVTLNPHISFGAPTAAGSRVRTETVASLARATDYGTTARALKLTHKAVEAAVRFEELLAA